MNTAFLKRGSGFLGRAAEAEARRRILVTAIALERYRGKNDSYPKTLADLAPEFLKTVPVDFMDGQPLRYRLTDNGHFVLYSVGLDCMDDGGKIQTRAQHIRANREGLPFGILPEADLVWPRPATAAEIADAERQEKIARARKADEIEELQTAAQWDHTAQRQAEAEKLLAQKAEPIPGDLKYQGHPLANVLHNEKVSGTNKFTLGEMLTLKQIITGAEPETVTFEAPIAYDVLTNLGSLLLYIDPSTNADYDEGCFAIQLECNRAPNDDCLLAWNTIYESPGKHALQMRLTLNEPPPNNPDISGPMLPFVVSNLCQFSLASAHFDPETGATLHAKLPEQNGSYTIELNTTNGVRLKTITGGTSNGVIKVHWDLMDDHGVRFTNDFFNSVFHITLPDSSRSQTMRGP